MRGRRRGGWRRKRMERERKLRRMQGYGRKREERSRGGGHEMKQDQVRLGERRGHKETSGEESEGGEGEKEIEERRGLNENRKERRGEGWR